MTDGKEREDDQMPEGHPLRPGDPSRLGAYRLVGRLGEGTQGVVFLGQDASGADVAIKLLHARMAAHPDARNRFVRELAAAKKVARFCTAQVLDADLAGDQPYIVSEYVEGRSLRAEILTEGARSGGALERLAISTLTALAAIHQAGVVHRDFNPQNVLLGADGPRVIDFGIARALGAARKNESNSLGTPAYMAPEQVTGGEIGPPVDMFAWGATILFAAIGRPPFGNESVPAVMDRIVRADPDVTPLPEPLRSVVAACLAKDPARRPTAQQAQAALLGQEPVGELTPPPAFGTAGGGAFAAPGGITADGGPAAAEGISGAPAAGGSAGRAAVGIGGVLNGPGGMTAEGTPTAPGGAPTGLGGGVADTASPGGPPDAPGGGRAPGPSGADGPSHAETSLVSRLSTRRWVVGAGAVSALAAVALAVALWPGGSAAVPPKTVAAAATPSPQSSSSAPNTPPNDTLSQNRSPHPSATPTPSPKGPGCKDYTRAYGLPGTGTVLLKGTVCRTAYSGTLVLVDTAPKDQWQACAQLRGHLTGSPGGFISTALIASKSGAVQSFDNGPTVRFGAKTKRTEDWVQLNAGRCRRSGGKLVSSWQTHERLSTD
ncbi:serine/threonine-protein kinase [Actinoallomurus sp. NPDC050550]|uniref:serine/threonine-protein kinase n=1 Tax=Actinoallomurus sp. NPDC050550 TaxID=3154937 RepID=UPI0033D04CCF